MTKCKEDIDACSCIGACIYVNEKLQCMLNAGIKIYRVTSQDYTCMYLLSKLSLKFISKQKMQSRSLPSPLSDNIDFFLLHTYIYDSVY